MARQRRPSKLCVLPMIFCQIIASNASTKGVIHHRSVLPRFKGKRPKLSFSASLLLPTAPAIVPPGQVRRHPHASRTAEARTGFRLHQRLRHRRNAGNVHRMGPMAEETDDRDPLGQRVQLLMQPLLAPAAKGRFRRPVLVIKARRRANTGKKAFSRNSSLRARYMKQRSKETTVLNRDVNDWTQAASPNKGLIQVRVS